MSLLATSFRTAVHHGDDARGPRADGAGGDVRRDGLRQRRRAHPARQRLPDRGPGPGLPPRPATRDDEPMVPHGMAVSLTAPEAFRFTFEAAPERHVRAAELLAPGATRPDDLRDFLPQVLTDLMRDIDIPNGIGAVGYDEGDVDDLVEGTLKQQRLLATAPREADRGRPRGHPAPLARAVVTGADLRRRAAPRRASHDVDDSTLARALYSTDASLYRVVPQVVVRPRHVDELAATVAVARETGTPLTMRGAGTSIAGNAVGTGIVVDITRHLNRVLVARPRGPHRDASQPGAVHATLQQAAAAARAALRPGPVDAHPLHDRRDDRQQRLRLARPGLRPHRRQRRRRSTCSPPTGSGSRSGAAAPLHDRLDALVADHLGDDPHRVRPVRPPGVRLQPRAPAARERPRPRRASWSAPRAPSAVVAGATVRLVEDAPHRALAVLGYPTWSRPPTPCPALLHAPAGRLRGPRLPDRRRGPRPARDRPRPAPRRRLAVRRGHRLDAPTRRGRAAAAVARDAGAVDVRLVDRRRARWPRCGGSARTAPGWPPAAWTGRRRPAGRTPRCRRSGSATTCATSTRCCASAGLDGVPYGHFGDGCVHVRIDFPLDRAARAGAASGSSSRRPPTWSPRTAAACRASTATAGPAPSCCPDVLARGDRPVRRGQAPLRPRQPAQPRRAGRPAAGRRRPAAGGPAARAAARPCGWPTTAARSSTPCTAAPASASASPTTPAPAA